MADIITQQTNEKFRHEVLAQSPDVLEVGLYT